METPILMSDLPLARQQLVTNIVKLYSNEGSPELVRKVYSTDNNMSFEDPISHAIGFKQVLSQWYSLQKIFAVSITEDVNILENSPNLLRFKLDQVYTFKKPAKSKSMSSVVVLELDNNDKVINHKDLWNGKELPKKIHFLRRINAKIVKKMCYK